MPADEGETLSSQFPTQLKIALGLSTFAIATPTLGILALLTNSLTDHIIGAVMLVCSVPFIFLAYKVMNSFRGSRVRRP